MKETLAMLFDKRAQAQQMAEVIARYRREIYEECIEDVRGLEEDMSYFLDAFDAWAASDEQCGGDLFDAMIAARESMR